MESTQQKLERNIKELVERFENLDKKQKEKYNEANVRKDFIDRLFESLGWHIHDSAEYSSEQYVRGAGFVDITFIVKDKPKIFLEAKKFGELLHSEARKVKTSTGGVYRLDWSPDERQVLHYAGKIKDIDFVIVTNFEIFRVFNAHNGILIMEFDDPKEFISRLEELQIFNQYKVTTGSLNSLLNRRVMEDIDSNFLNTL
jgi:hypothetical protein